MGVKLAMVDALVANGWGISSSICVFAKSFNKGGGRLLLIKSWASKKFSMVTWSVNLMIFESENSFEVGALKPAKFMILNAFFGSKLFYLCAYF